MQFKNCLSQSGYTTKPTIARFTHSPLDILSVEADVSHEQGNPFLCLKFPQTVNSHALRIACLKVDNTDETYNARFTHSPLDILFSEADVAHKQGKPFLCL